MERYLEKEKIRYLSNPFTTAYGIDAFFHEHEPKMVILVDHKKELEKTVGYLYDNAVAFCVRGAGTGYTGAAVPIDGEVIVVTTKLDKIQSVNVKERTATVEPGVTPFMLNEHVKKCRLRYPPDPASFKVCTIGGNAATNAGGPHCYLYGVTSNHVRRIKCFLPNGSDLLTLGAESPYSLVYDLKDLFIGSEGTLGVFSEIKVKLEILPPAVCTYLIFFDTYKKAVQFIEEAILAGVVPAALDMSIDPYIPNSDNSKSTKLLVSVEGGFHSIEKIQNYITLLLSKYADDYIVGEEDKLMEIRSSLVKENVTKTLIRSGKPQYFLFDAVVPRNRLSDILDYIYYLADRLNLFLMNTFHAGDGNIHPTVFYDPENEEDMRALKAFWYAVLKKVMALKGSITGEHGIGIEKRDIFSFFGNKDILRIHHDIKNYFDPRGVLCPAKVFRDKQSSREVIDDLEQLLDRFEIKTDFTTQNISNFDEEILSGVIKVSSDDTLSGLNLRLEEYSYFIPYSPVIFHDKSLSSLIKCNIPSFYGHIFELQDIIMGAEFVGNDEVIRIGKKVLKNVAGYSLKILLYNEEILGTIESFYLKIFPRTTNFESYLYFHLELDDIRIIDEFIETFGNSILNLVIMRKEEKFNVVIVTYNDMDTLFIDNFAKSNKITYETYEDFHLSPFACQNAIIIGISEKDILDNISDISDDFIYLFTEKCIVIPVYDPHQMDHLLKNLESSSLKPRIEAVRHVGNNGNENVFLADYLEKQIHITEELVTHMKKFNMMEPLSSNPGFEVKESSEISSAVFDEVQKCSRCGLCLFGCPQYQQRKEEQFSLRGTISLIRSGISRDLIREFLDECFIQCKDRYPCEELCPTGISFSNLISEYL